MKLGDFLNQLANLSFENAFNPYADVCAMHDDDDSPGIRRQNLEALLQALPTNLESMWVGRDLGYRGARRTGIPLTDEAHIEDFAATYRRTDVKKATTTAPVAERTAAEAWKIINLLLEPPLLWNVFPLHPYEPSNPLSNRTHSRKERKESQVFIEILVELFKPQIIVAIGNDAFSALSEMGLRPVYVRHPSYGGKTDFVNGMNKIYGLDHARFQLSVN